MEPIRKLFLSHRSPLQSIGLMSLVSSLPGSPIRLRLKPRTLNGWRTEGGIAHSLPRSPVKSSALKEKISPIPYSAAKLRITAFPVLGD